MSAKKTRGRSIFSVVSGLAFSGLSLLIFFNKQYIIDWVAFQQFTPTTEIAQIAERTTMNDTGKFYFYSAKPVIDSTQNFNKDCERKEASSAILGCYTSGSRIFIYGISNDQLDGIKDVTAAHETLHAIYQRMSPSEMETINSLVEKEYAKLQTDKNLSERMQYYAKQEPKDRDNELHSILGTEYANLDPALEAHYAKYFTNRGAIVSLHAKYASVFDDLKAKTDALSTELKTLGKTIETESSQYNADARSLNDAIQAFNDKATNGGFTSRAVFDSERAALVKRADQLDSSRQQVNSDSQKYETLRQQYNETASSSNQLYKSLDSNLAPAPSL